MLTARVDRLPRPQLCLPLSWSPLPLPSRMPSRSHQPSSKPHPLHPAQPLRVGHHHHPRLRRLPVGGRGGAHRRHDHAGGAAEGGGGRRRAWPAWAWAWWLAAGSGAGQALRPSQGLAGRPPTQQPSGHPCCCCPHSHHPPPPPARQVNEFQTQCKRLPLAVRDWAAYKDCRRTIDDLLDLLPLFQALAHKAVKERCAARAGAGAVLNRGRWDRAALLRGLAAAGLGGRAAT